MNGKANKMNRKFNQSLLVAKINKILSDRGWSVNDLARQLVIKAPAGLKPTPAYLSGIMSGKNKPGVEYLALFADVAGCSTEDFFDQSGGLEQRIS